jgi:hypothetical protein
MSPFMQSVFKALFAIPSCVDAMAQRWRRLTRLLFDPYRPELHFMRGPGPKWREKHARTPGFAG